MCGINGIVELEQRAVAPERQRARIAAMNRAIAHRGPDDEGSHFAPGVNLGFRRLAILDLSAAGHQPMLSDDGRYALVFNGEIYNHVELAAELRALGHRFASRCDAEVLLKAYQQWGAACLRRFNGMWAFAIWDARERRLFAARDRFGVKPFVYTQRGGEFVFSSEMAGLRAALPLHEANLGKLHEYLAWGYRRNDGETFFDGVHELPPAHQLVVADGRVRQERWWQLDEARPEELSRTSTAEREEQLRQTLADAVRLRLRSDVPVALLQSGGLDSSIIAVLVNEARAAAGEGAAPVSAFTAVYPGQVQDESAAVHELMRHCPQLRSVCLAPDAGEMAAQLPGFVAAMQEPVASTTVYAHWFLMRAVREQGIKVMLNGQGADEAMAGYGRYLSGYRLLDLWQSAPWRVPAEMAAVRSLTGQGLGAQLAQTAKAVLGRRAAAAWRGRFSEGSVPLLAPAFHAAHAARLPAGLMRWRADNLRTHLRRQLLVDGFNQILHYEDQSAMSQGIEMRSPFVDYRFMQLAFALPDEERFSLGITKRLLRQAFAARLPASISQQHRKIGFATPFAQWAAEPSFQKLLQSMVGSPTFRSRRIWRADALGARLLAPQAAAGSFPLWRFVNVELWLRQMEISNA